MKKDSKHILDISLRYSVLLLAAIFGLVFFYYIFTPLTVAPVYFLLDLFFQVSLVSETLIKIGENLTIEFVPACIAGAAYLLLLIINLSTPSIKLKKRISMILVSFLAFLAINVLRIFILSVMAYSHSPLFDATHIIFWYLLSTIFVVGIWFAQVKYFKISKIPFYSDMKFLYGSSKRR